MSAKKKVLIAIPYLPFPVRSNGVSIRYFPIIQYLSKTCDIHLLVISAFSGSPEALQEASQYVKRVSYHTRETKKIKLIQKLKVRLLAFLPSHKPFPMYCYDHDEIESFIKSAVNEEVYDVALTVTSWYAEHIRNHVRAKWYSMDVIDSLYAIHSRKVPMNLIEKYDTLKIKDWENRRIAEVDYASYISPMDCRMVTDGRYPEDKVSVIPNGIYIQDKTEEKIAMEGFVLGYLGNMAYDPNIRAALRLYKIFLMLKPRFPYLKLLIIGRTPVPEVREMEKTPDVIVTGAVDNIWRYVNAVNVFVFPMEIGGGQQNKLLEAMCAGIPVVSTPLGNTGIGAKHGEAILEADTDDEFVQVIAGLIEDESKQNMIGAKGKQYIETTFQWSSIFKKIDANYLGIRKI